jgi:hypothetical protein
LSFSRGANDGFPNGASNRNAQRRFTPQKAQNNNSSYIYITLYNNSKNNILPCHFGHPPASASDVRATTSERNSHSL